MAYGKYTGFKGWLYKGSVPYYGFALHRLSAFAIIFFVGLHVLASFSMQQDLGTWGTAINIIYESPWFQILVVFSVLFHTLNGLRVVILDFFPKLIKYTREAVYLQWGIFIPIFLITVYLLIMNGISGGA